MTPGRPRRVLVAGIGNVFLGDDGFGVEVVRRLDASTPPAPLPETVDVADFGIRGVHLAYELLDGRHDTLIMVDAVPLDGPPGTLAVLDVSGAAADDDGAAPAVDGHGMDPFTVLRLLHRLGGAVDRALVVGCRPATVDERMGLSEPVAAAVPEAVRLVTDVAREEAARIAGADGAGHGQPNTDEGVRADA